jgi:hypothetical protein
VGDQGMKLEFKTLLLLSYSDSLNALDKTIGKWTNFVGLRIQNARIDLKINVKKTKSIKEEQEVS